MTLLDELQNLMAKYRFRPNKKIAQHFVINENFVKKLVQLADLKKEDKVLEIGPGTGFLTKALLEKCSVVAVEIDENLCELLQQELHSKKLQLVCGDFLKAKLPSFNKVVALPPYSHSAAIVYKLLEYDFELAVLVFQKEFAEKLVAEPGFDEYSALSVLTQYAFESRLLERIPPGFFFPKPRDESSIVVLNAKKRFGIVADEGNFSFFAKTVFRFQNKNLKNALAKGRQFLLPKLKFSESEFKKRAEKMPFLQEKVNLLSVAEFVEAFNFLTGKN